MKIDIKRVDKVAKELKLDFSDAELKDTHAYLERITEFIKDLPKTSVNDQDISEVSLSIHDATMNDGSVKPNPIDLSLNSKHFQMNHFEIPRVMGED